MISTSFWPSGNGHDHADPRQRHADAGALRHHAQVAVQRQLAAAGDGVAVHERDGRMPRALHPLQHADHVALGSRRRRATPSP
jgi:hypothetical protein